MLKRFCTRCGEKKPATTEYFYEDKQEKSGFEKWCKQCYRDYVNENYGYQSNSRYYSNK